MRSAKYKWIIGALAAAAVLLGILAWYVVWGAGDHEYEKEGVLVRVQNERLIPSEELVYIRKCQGV